LVLHVTRGLTHLVVHWLVWITHIPQFSHAPYPRAPFAPWTFTFTDSTLPRLPCLPSFAVQFGSHAPHLLPHSHLLPLWFLVYSRIARYGLLWFARLRCRGYRLSRFTLLVCLDTPRFTVHPTLWFTVPHGLPHTFGWFTPRGLTYHHTPLLDPLTYPRLVYPLPPHTFVCPSHTVTHTH